MNRSAPGSTSRLRVLISSAGRRVGLLRAVRQAGQDLGLEVQVYGSDAEPEMSAACLLADGRFGVRRASEPGFIQDVMTIASHESIDLVIPTIDPELIAFAHAADEFASFGTWVAIGQESDVRICRDKEQTMQRLSAAGVPVPSSFSLEEARGLDDARAPFDMIVKPSAGSSSQGLMIVPAGEKLPAVEHTPHLAQRMIKGREFTVNVFVDRRGTVRCVVPHERLRVRGGEVEKGVTIRFPALEEIGRSVARALPGLRGPFCYQAIVDETSSPFVIEVNARIGGGYPLAHVAGAPFVRWLLEERLGRTPSFSNDWTEDVTMIRFDDAVYKKHEAD
jgi:carbamoyl-phosphate synthase large subunit